MNTDLTHQLIAVVGYGITGRACVRFLRSKQAQVYVLDKRVLDKNALEKDVSADVFSDDYDLSAFDLVVLSPGVSPHQTCFVNYQKQGGKVIGDIELFAWFNTTPLIGVTGSNGKTTVTDMLGKVLTAAGFNVALAGNYGKGALDLLLEAEAQNDTHSAPYDFIVLELSSFQLEMTSSLSLKVATVLNVTEDHIDRHGSFEAYREAKQKIFANTDTAVVNLDEKTSYPDAIFKQAIKQAIFISKKDNAADFFATKDSAIIHNKKPQQAHLFRFDEMRLKGEHNLTNAMTVLAICHAMSINLEAVIKALLTYEGLAHRFEIVLEQQNKTWINDSKATNVGACLAALDCFHADDYLVLIAGGDAKGADLMPLQAALKTKVNELIVFGKDADAFLSLQPSGFKVPDLAEAVKQAQNFIQEQTKATVLLSPACASIDMFKNYQARGELFCDLVKQQTNVKAVEVSQHG